ncbi:ChaN family lipoprotein [Aquirufa nivalisilvae]|uniref:ChaN family lipoprotein n=1 Tax=Aquirufa nivalisilvae TaxID=2516557 RepID=UPI0022A99341|nr:ChaN family lipoprotein [Aquirufa nivalisilvae]MCZ2481636.1 ChaN family lipoprotein [Aquirufa nivalisilvae]
MIKAIHICIVFFLLFPVKLLATDKPAYRLFNAKGKEVSYQKMIKQIQKQDVVLIGELHNNPISHWLELEIIQSCYLQRKLVLGAEMFEQDNQGALSAYLAGKISAKGLDSSARLWRNYKTDYAPLVNFAKENQVNFIATNVPRKYASLVSKGGFEALNQISAEEKSWMAPLPIAYDANLPCYQKMITMMAGHATPNMPKAQALKDATMAYFIMKNWEENKLFIHVNGSYHSENYEGISWYLKLAKPAIKIATIATVSQKEIKQLAQENRGIADYIICVEDDMTTTY